MSHVGCDPALHLMMQPQFEHPFTLHDAIQFETGLITEEIARLQNSLARLAETQAHLDAFVAEAQANAEEMDKDILDAIGDNRVVIASQIERIQILRMALERKGVVRVDNPHYDLVDVGTARPESVNAPAVASSEISDQHAAPRRDPSAVAGGEAEGEGVFL